MESVRVANMVSKVLIHVELADPFRVEKTSVNSQHEYQDHSHTAENNDDFSESTVPSEQDQVEELTIKIVDNHSNFGQHP